MSIIIPVYNVEEYIEKCIVSLQDQDLSKDEYEIIIINDGSPDNSREIVLRLMELYGNIVFIEQENKGVSIARNNGISRATGTYIMPIDPDDYVLPNSLKRILEKAIVRELDVIYLGFTILDQNDKLTWSTSYKEMEGKLFSGVDAYFAVRGEEVRDPDRSWAILYRRSLLQQFAIDYPEEVPYLEDGLFLAKVFCVAERCGFDSAPFYQRTTRPGSATNSKLFYDERALNGFIMAADDIRSFRKKYNLAIEKSNLVNHVIAKFILLPVTSCVGARDWNGYKKIKQRIVEMGFTKLELKGCRGVYYTYASHFNKSKDWFFFYYRFQLIMKSINYRIAKSKSRLVYIN